MRKAVADEIMAKATVAAPRESAKARTRQAPDAGRRRWLCPHCALDVYLIQDRVRDCIVRHPKIIVRETQYWRCPVCHAVADCEFVDHAEHIEYIASDG